MAVEVRPAHQGQQLGGGPVEQGAVGVAAEHHTEAEAPRGPGHQQGLRQPAALEQLDVHPVDVGGKTHQVGQVPAALVGHQGDGAVELQGGKRSAIGLRILEGGQGLLHQRHALGTEPAEHRPGLLQAPAAVGIHLQLAGHPMALEAPLQRLGHRPHQGPVVVQALRAAELELDAAGGQLAPPALQPLQHRRLAAQAQGDAGGDDGAAIEAPEPPQRLTQPLPPPVVQGQIDGAAGRRRERLQQRVEGLERLRDGALEGRQDGLQFGGQVVSAVGPVTGVEAAGLAAAGDAVVLEFQQQVLDGGGGAAADGQGHHLGEREAAQAAAHARKEAGRITLPQPPG